MKNILPLLVFSLAICNITHAQNWKPFGDTDYWNVFSLYHDTTDNSLYIGGNFYLFDGLEAKGLVRWDGQSFSTLGDFPNQIWGLPSSTDAVMSITRYKGEIYCTLINGPWEPGEIRGLARWDGVDWDSIAGIRGTVFGQVVYNDDLYILGRFQMVDDDTAAMVIRWDGEQWHDTGFSSWIGTREEGVYGGIVYNGDLYVGGNFWNADGSVKDVARFDGENWHPVANVNGGWDDVGDFIEYKGELYASGDFKKSSGNAANLIMKLKDGQWTDVGGSFAYGGGWINKMINYQGKLYVFGTFYNEVGGIPVDDIAVWDGERWCGLGSVFNKEIVDAVEYEGDIIVGGGWEFIDGDTIPSIARWVGGDYLDSCGLPVSAIVFPEEKASFSLYPNPAITSISISTENIKAPATLSAHNLLGQPVWQKALPPPNGDIHETVDVSTWPPGVYFFTLRVGGQVWSEKAVIRE